MSEELLRTVGRTLDLLKVFRPDSPHHTVADLVERLGTPRSVVTRMLATLEQAGFVERVAGQQRLFRVGPAACEVGALYLQGHPRLRGADAEQADAMAAAVLHAANAIGLRPLESAQPRRRRSDLRYVTSNKPAAPMPPPTHMVTTT